MKTGYWHINSGDESHFWHHNGKENLFIHPGKAFNEEFQKTSWSTFKSYIESNHIPALVFWGSCSACLSFRKNALSHDNFKSYASSSVGQTYMYFIASEAGINSDVKAFCKSSTMGFPYIRLYWKKSDGSVSDCDVSRGTTGYSNSASGATHLVNKMKSTFSGYIPATKVTITFDANGGQGSYGPSEAIKGQSFTLPGSAVFRKSGYKQNGWQIGSTSYAFSASFTPTANTTVKATWIVDGTPEPTPSPDIPVDDPTFIPPAWQFSKGTKIVAASKDKFPYKWQYKSTGYKRIAISNNISSLNAHGVIENAGLESQIISAYIQPGILEIEPRCFYNCTNLVGINADNSVRRVGEYAFYNCHSLQAINFLGDANKYLQVIGSHAFDGCGFRSIKINHKGSVSDSSLDEWCFANNKELTAVQFLQSTYLGAHMFDGCEKLTNIKLNNYHSYVGDYAFANCKSLAKITFPPNIYMISEHMFDGCTNLTQIIFESGSQLRQIGDYAFANCPKLTSITLPPSVNDLGYLDPQWLAGSSIDRVVFQGLSDEVFSEKHEAIKELNYQTNHWYTSPTDIKAIYKEARENHIPIIAGTGLPFCDFCRGVYGYSTSTSNNVTSMDVSTIRFNTTGRYSFDNKIVGDYLKPKNCFWLFGVQSGVGEKGAWYSTYSESYWQIEKTFDVASPNVVTIIYWLKEDGTEIKHVQTGALTGNSPDAVATSWENILKNKIGAYSGSATEVTIQIKSPLNSFGRGAPVIFVSSSGTEYKCENNVITKLPTYRVDHKTADNFKYNIWYYNARELKAFADQSNLPVLAEWGARSCDPCRDFAKNTFRKKEFQDELKKRSCLLCKVQLEREGSFSSQPATSQEYFISHNWGDPNTYIPQLIFYWKKSLSETYRVVWNYNYRSDPSNANYQTVLNKLDAMLGNYTGDARYVAPVVSTSENNRYRYYAAESIVTSGYTIESGKYVKADGTVASISTVGYAVVTISVDPTCRYYIYTCCDSSHCIHAYNSSGQVVGGIKNSSGTIIGSECVVDALPSSVSHTLAVYRVELPSNATTLKITNAYQAANGSSAALPLKYRATYDNDGRYFICDKKTQATSWNGQIEINMPAILHTGAGDETNARESTHSTNSSSNALLQASTNEIHIGKTIDLADNWYQWCIPDPAQLSFIDKSGVIFKVYDMKVESIWTFENEDEVIELDHDGLKYPIGQWHVIDDSTGSVAVSEIVDQCEKLHIPLIILESSAAATDFDINIKASGEFNTWVKRQNCVFVDARSSSWSLNGPKTLREFETRTQFDGNSTSDALPKLLVYNACSTCTDSGDLDIDCKKKITFNSSWTPKQYIDQIEFYLTL